MHGIFIDPYDGRIWVTTGDDDHESAIWFTDDEFKTLEKVVLKSNYVYAKKKKYFEEL